MYAIRGINWGWLRLSPEPSMVGDLQKATKFETREEAARESFLCVASNPAWIGSLVIRKVTAISIQRREPIVVERRERTLKDGRRITVPSKTLIVRRQVDHYVEG